MQKIYIDIENLLKSKSITGIQRVVINVVLGFLEKAPEKTVLLRSTGYWRSFEVISNESFMERFAEFDSEVSITLEGDIDVDEISAGDVFFDIDAVWHNDLNRSRLLPALKNRGVRIVPYIHDLFPVLFPQIVDRMNVIKFIDYIGAHLQYADHMITTSESNVESIKLLCAEMGLPVPDCSVVPLASELPPSDAGNADAGIRETLSGRKYVLCVCTIEPRKNHPLLLDAFDQELFAEGLDLVLVGRKGWDCDETIGRIEHSPQFGKKLFWLSGISNDSLAWLYKNAFVTAFPSLAEGFGLPLIESMQYGTPVIASDIPVFREIGGDSAEYFDNRDAQAFCDKVHELAEDPEKYARLKEKAERYVPLTWSQAADGILGVLSELEPEDRKAKTGVKQMVILTARLEDISRTLPYIDRFMPFIKELVLCCPDALAERLDELPPTRLEIKALTDTEVLAGRELPEDHSTRNFFLRCLAMRSDVIDDVFIMSDDDYRPLQEIDESVFVEDGKYKGYYYFDCIDWTGTIIGNYTSFDIAAFKTAEFLQKNGYPTKQYSSHMPQIIDKEIYLEMLEEHKGIESTGLQEWDIYFNYLQGRYPRLLEPCKFVSIAWPEDCSAWVPQVKPNEYLFENFYNSLYGVRDMFHGFSTECHDGCEEENAKKIEIFDKHIYKYKSWENAYDVYVSEYERNYKEYPIICVNVGDVALDIRGPSFFRLPRGGIVRIPIMFKSDDGCRIDCLQKINADYGFFASQKIVSIVRNGDYKVRNGIMILKLRIPSRYDVSALYLRIESSGKSGKISFPVLSQIV